MLRELETNENEHGDDVKCLSETINLLLVETTHDSKERKRKKEKKEQIQNERKR